MITRRLVLRFSTAMLAVLALILTALAGVAHAADVTSSESTSVVPAVVSLQPWVVAILSGTVTPLITGLITKLSATPGTKAIVSLGLVAAATAVNLVVTNNGVFILRDVVVLFFTTLVAHAAAYAQVWEPIGTGGTTFTNELTPNVGFGPAGA